MGFLNGLRDADAREAQRIRESADTAGPPLVGDASDSTVPTGVSPGTERWPVKTGSDDDVGNVAKLVVATTVREIGGFPRPDGLLPPTSDPPQFQSRRAVPLETTVWRLKASIIALRLEKDGDYHLVLQDDSGAMMIAEVPLPDPAFVATTSPFFSDIAAARNAVDLKFSTLVGAVAFSPSADGTLVPRDALAAAESAASAQSATRSVDLKAITKSPQEAQPFAMRIDPTLATLTGVGFFDRDHGQTGRAPNIVELHPVLKLEFR